MNKIIIPIFLIVIGYSKNIINNNTNIYNYFNNPKQINIVYNSKFYNILNIKKNDNNCSIIDKYINCDKNSTILIKFDNIIKPITINMKKKSKTIKLTKIKTVKKIIKKENIYENILNSLN